MAKLYFKYGAMGSSKSAQALTTKFNYEEKGMTVWLIKPGTDTRDGADIIRSRIGLQHKAQIIHPDDDIIKAYHEAGDFDVIIADEAQFLTPEQIDGLRWLVDEKDIPVLCFGLRTDFLTHFFPGARRLMELADSITEIKTIHIPIKSKYCSKKAVASLLPAIEVKTSMIPSGADSNISDTDSPARMSKNDKRPAIRKISVHFPDLRRKGFF